MRLVVHMGFHKTASTFLQQLLAGNRAALAGRGVWYDDADVYGAHHPIANPLLAGDPAPLAAMLRRARAAGCETVLLSSENLEALPFVPDVATLLEATAKREGVDSIEWHVVIREPGAYFQSQHAQLSRHTYADAAHMFSEVMKKGVLFMPEPHRFPGAAPYWFFCFDHEAFLRAFAGDTRTLFVHDYADDAPYPGWRMIARLGIADALVEQPAPHQRNHRLSRGQVHANLRERLCEAVADPVLWDDVTAAVETSIAANFATVGAYARAVGERFNASYCDALALSAA